MKLFEVKDVSHDFGKGPVLSNVNFQIAEGERFGIIGPNGSGKSTLVKAMSGLLVPNQGEILLFGKTIKSYRKKDLARLIAVLEQEGTPPVSFTVQEVVSMGRYPWLSPFSDITADDDKIIEHVLKTLNLWEMKDYPVNTLSGGQRQLVSLARAMVQQPRILILDEPTTFLDIGHQMLVMEHIRHWHEENQLTIIMVLHDLNLAGQYCRQLLLMNQGKIQTWGNVMEVLKVSIISNVYQTELIQVNHPVLGVPQFLLTSR